MKKKGNLVINTKQNTAEKLPNVDIVETVEKEPKNETIHIKIKKLDENAVIPSYAHDGDVCMDLTAIAVEYDEENDTYIYHTGLAFESDKNIGQFLFLRSCNCKKECYLTNGVGVADSAIYRGEIQFRFKNRESLRLTTEIASEKVYNRTMFEYLKKYSHTLSSFEKVMNEAMSFAWTQKVGIEEKIKESARNLEFAPYKVGDRIGQMVFLQYPTVELEVCDELSDTDRGANGFGSTGN